MNKLLEYTLNKYQEKISQLKLLKPNTVGYEHLMKDIDSLQDKLNQLREQIATRKR